MLEQLLCEEIPKKLGPYCPERRRLREEYDQGLQSHNGADKADRETVVQILHYKKLGTCSRTSGRLV